MQDGIHDAFVERYAEAITALRVEASGDPTAKDVALIAALEARALLALTFLRTRGESYSELDREARTLNVEVG